MGFVAKKQSVIFRFCAFFKIFCASGKQKESVGDVVFIFYVFEI